jgi:transcriptional antiterminator NusG
MLGKMDEIAEAGGMSMSEPFIVGETIKIIEGIHLMISMASLKK